MTLFFPFLKKTTKWQTRWAWRMVPWLSALIIAGWCSLSKSGMPGSLVVGEGLQGHPCTKSFKQLVFVRNIRKQQTIWFRGWCNFNPSETRKSLAFLLPTDRKPRSRNWGFSHGEVFGGVGWVGDDNVPCTCTHVCCYATGCFSRTCTHVGCYATRFFLLSNTCEMLRKWWGGVGWGEMWKFCQSTKHLDLQATWRAQWPWISHVRFSRSCTFPNQHPCTFFQAAWNAVSPRCFLWKKFVRGHFA